MPSARWVPDKEVRALAIKCERMGWTVTKSGNNHLLVIAPNGERISMSSTPSAQDSLRAYRAKVQRILKQLKQQNKEQTT